MYRNFPHTLRDQPWPPTPSPELPVWRREMRCLPGCCSRCWEQLLLPVFPGGFQASQPLTLGDVSTLCSITPGWRDQISSMGRGPRNSTVLTGEPKTLLFPGLGLAARFVNFCQSAGCYTSLLLFFPEKETISDLQSCSRTHGALIWDWDWVRIG